jgi:hypothetical protein
VAFYCLSSSRIGGGGRHESSEHGKRLYVSPARLPRKVIIFLSSEHGIASRCRDEQLALGLRRQKPGNNFVACQYLRVHIDNMTPDAAVSCEPQSGNGLYAVR